MFLTALLISLIVCALVQVGGRARQRSAALGFLAALAVSLVLLMQGGHWDFGNPTYYASVAGAALLGALVTLVVFSLYDSTRRHPKE